MTTGMETGVVQGPLLLEWGLAWLIAGGLDYSREEAPSDEGDDDAVGRESCGRAEP